MAETQSPQTAVTHRQILAVALPLVLANMAVPLIGLADTYVIGRIGSAAPMAAVGLGAVAISTLYWLFGFLRMGTVGLTSQARGAGDDTEVAALLLRCLIIGVAAGAALIALQIPLFAATLWLIPAEPGVEALTHTYMQIRVFSAPAAIAMYGITGWLIAKERTRAVMALQLVLNGTNVVLDFLFVLGFGWGIAGVAWASFVAEWGTAALGLWMCRQTLWNTTATVWARVQDMGAIRNMMAVNRDIMIRSVLLMAGFTSFGFLGGFVGTVALAANSILIQFVHVTAHAMDGFAFASEIFVGKAFGAKRRGHVRLAAIRTSLWGAGISFALALIFGLFGGVIIDFLTTAPNVRVEARNYLIWMVLGPLLGWPCWMLDGIFIGATRARDMRNMMVISFLGYVLALVISLPLFGNHGLWFSVTFFYVLRGLTLAMRYPALERAGGGGPP